MSDHRVHPPRWADRLLESLLHGEALEEVQGDLHESFLWRLEDQGPRYAKWHFIKEIIQSIRITNLKPYPFMSQLSTMFRSHIKTGWRFLWKTKGYSAINITGLAVGIVFSWFAYQYAADQFSYNKHLKNVDQLYRMSMQADMMGNTISLPGGSYKAATRIVEDLPEVTDVALFAEEKRLVNIKGSAVQQSILTANKTLMEYLKFDFLEGEVDAFDAPRQAVISERMAYKLGLRGEAVGKFLVLQDSTAFTEYQILGVYRDIPENTSIQTDVLLSLAEFLDQEPGRKTEYLNFDLSVIFQLTPEASIITVNDKIKALFDRESGSEHFSAALSPIATYHLDDQAKLGHGFSGGGNKQLISFIAIAGILCLVISIINYANFSISLYLNRAREVAVRKIIGAHRKGVFQQLMTEALLTTLLATVLAVVLYLLLAPQFSSFVEKTFDFHTLIDKRFIPGNLGLIVLISLLSGLYPAFLLSRFEILRSLKGTQKTGKGKTVMQSLLVVQFAISTVMIVCMFIFQGQLDLLINRDKGQDISDVIRIDFPPEMIDKQKTNAFLNELRQLSIVEEATGSSGYSMHPYDDGATSFALLNMLVDSSHLNVMGYRFVAGGSFSAPAASSKEVIVTEAFLKQINMEDPIGKTIPFGRDDNEESVIVGVIQDVFLSAKSEPGSKVYFQGYDTRQLIRLFLKVPQSPSVIAESIEPIWDEFFYPFPFSYDFLEEAYTRKLDNETKIAKISGLGSVIAIFIAAFGLLGLVGVTIRQKLKRVSISRVLGAEHRHIARMISGKFIVPILISLSIGLAASVYLGKSWLDAYPVRIDLSWYYLALASVLVLGVIAMIIWMQVSAALKKNPVIYLKED